jgi:hypothetical protein
VTHLWVATHTHRLGITGLEAEWHFFAKSLCDGIGGTVKRLVARASLQATETNHIVTANDMFQWACQNIKGITFVFVSANDVEHNEKQYELDLRYSAVKTLSGTRSHHSFIPVSELDETAVNRRHIH